MESLDDSPIDAKKTAAIERVSIGKVESDKLASWLSQVQAVTGGFLNLSKTDLVNFLVRYHADELGAKEIQKLRLAHYDPLKHLTWITTELKAALLANDVEAIRRLQTELKNIELSVAVGDAALIESLAPIPGKQPGLRKRRPRPDAVDSADAVFEIKNSL